MRGYENVSDEKLLFDIDQASILEPTPTKPNSARSATDVLYKGENIGKLFVIAFKPGDGSGDESGYKLDELKVDNRYPHGTQVVPRNKTGIYSEGHLVIASQKIDDAHSEPKLFEGTFDLLSLDGKTVKKIGELGNASSVDLLEFAPLTTLTVGYDAEGKRFGDPHAVYSARPETLQLCGFLAISDEVYQQHPGILDSLHPQMPHST